MGAWQRPEVQVALDRALHDAAFRVFLVLLPGMPDPFDPTVDRSVLEHADVGRSARWSDDLAGVDRLVRAVQGLPIEGSPVAAGDGGMCVRIGGCCRSARPTAPGSSVVMVTSSGSSRS